ncbi:MAG: STAS domain-containing protein [Rhizomicrobium sp.]
MSVQEKREVTLRVADEANVRNIVEIHARLLDAYRNNAAVVLDLSDLGDVDLTFVQLIEAARRTAAADGKAITLAAPAMGLLLDTLERGGFLSSKQDNAFWLCATEMQ